MGMAVDGLVSNLDTTALINSLMQVEGVPQTLLKNKVATSQSLISALQALNAKVAALADLATGSLKPGALDLSSATTNSPKVTASAATGAFAGQVDVTVNTLAQGQKSVSDAMSVWPDSPAILTVRNNDGTLHQVTAATTSLDDIVKAVNASGSSVTATKVSVGGGNYRLQLSSTGVGAGSGFSVFRGTSADVTAGTAQAVALNQIQGAQDASLTLWPGSGAAQTITSRTNTFTDLLPGVSLTVSGTSPDPVTVTVKRDDAAISKIAGALVAAVGGILADIIAKSTVTKGTDSTGTSTSKGGVFTGDSTVRDVSQRILSAATLPVNGRSPSEFGISIAKSGSVEFDSDKFTAALAKDPAATEAALREIASRVAAAAATVSDKRTGTLTTKVTGQQSEVTDLGHRIDDWDRRLATRRSTLERTYSALEVALGKLNSQSSYLASQLAGLSGSHA